MIWAIEFPFLCSLYYFFTGKQFEYFRRKVDENSTFQTLSEDNGMLCYVRPSTIGFNFGISIGLGGSPDHQPSSPNNFNLPFCELITNSSCEAGAITLQLIADWGFMQPHYELEFSVSSPSNSILYRSPNNNQPLSSGTGNRVHTIQFDSSMSGTSITARMIIKDPTTGAIICNKPIPVTLPDCMPDPEFCSVSAKTKCVNGVSYASIATTWMNASGNGTINLEFLDINSQPLPNTPIVNGNPSAFSTPSGSRTFNNIDLTQYAGQTILAKVSVCFEYNGAPFCCEKIIKIPVPQCCDDCEGIQIIDQTDGTQTDGGTQRVVMLYTNLINNGLGITKMLITLESFGANNSTNQNIEPIPNFEISAIPTTSGQTFTATSIGSFGTGTTGRSNLWLLDFSTNPFTGGSIYMLVTPYDRKILKNYRVKFTLYRTDGTICEDYLNYNQ